MNFEICRLPPLNGHSNQDKDQPELEMTPMPFAVSSGPALPIPLLVISPRHSSHA